MCRHVLELARDAALALDPQPFLVCDFAIAALQACGVSGARRKHVDDAFGAPSLGAGPPCLARRAPCLAAVDLQSIVADDAACSAVGTVQSCCATFARVRCRAFKRARGTHIARYAQSFLVGDFTVAARRASRVASARRKHVDGAIAAISIRSRSPGLAWRAPRLVLVDR